MRTNFSSSNINISSGECSLGSRTSMVYGLQKHDGFAAARFAVLTSQSPNFKGHDGRDVGRDE